MEIAAKAISADAWGKLRTKAVLNVAHHDFQISGANCICCIKANEGK
jgi:hypothetical protein